MKTFFRKYQIYFWLIGIIVVMGVIKIKYAYNPGQYQEKQLGGTIELVPTVTPTTVPTKTQEEKDYPLIDQLPYRGTGYVIDRYVKPKVLAIKVKGKDQELIKDEVAKWLRDNNVNPTDFQIKWE